jgi:glycosyltransferase involved in cell wall biosynthesis
MRIAVLSWTSRRVGGTETYLTGIIPALVRAGHDVAFWHEVDEPAERDPIVSMPNVPMWSAGRLGATAALAALQHWTPDVIYAHGLLSPRLEARALDIAPAAFFAHGYYGACISGAKAFSRPVRQPCSRQFGAACLLYFYPRRCGGLNPIAMATEYTRQAARLALLPRYRAILTHSEHMRLEYMRYPGLETRVYNCSYAIEPEAAPPVPDVEPTDVQTGGGRAELLFVGRMDDLKGGDVLLDALPAVGVALDRPVHLTFAGDGPERRRWESLSRRIMNSHPAIAVSFHGWQSAVEISALLSAADLLVVPSLWPEPYGLVGMEAGRRGVPAAAFAVGGIPEWLKPGVNGYLAPANPPTSQGLAAAIVQCLRSPQRHVLLRQGARAMASHRDNAERHLDALVKVLTEVARARASR